MAEPRQWIETEYLASGNELIQRRRHVGHERLVLMQKQKQREAEQASRKEQEQTE